MSVWFGKGCEHQCCQWEQDERTGGPDYKECTPVLIVCGHQDNPEDTEGNCYEDICPIGDDRLGSRTVYYVESFHEKSKQFLADSDWNTLEDAQEQRDLLHERSERVRLIEETITRTVVSEDGPGCTCGADDDPPDKALPHKTWCPVAND